MWTQTPSPALVFATDPGPWAWSLSNLIALLGAIATVAIAGLALAQTWRANRLAAEARRREEESQVRAQRNAFADVARAYLDSWNPAEGWTEERHQKDMRALWNLYNAAAAHNAMDVAQWLTGALVAANNAATDYQVRHMNDPIPPPNQVSLLRDALEMAKLRIMGWVQVGELQRLPPLADYLDKRDGIVRPEEE